MLPLESLPLFLPFLLYLIKYALIKSLPEPHVPSLEPRSKKQKVFLTRSWKIRNIKKSCKKCT